MKSIKEGEVRRREILDTARKLFVTKGYEQTSVNDILKIVDIAKGTFYYYFSSKEEVLEAIILDIVEEGAIRAERIIHDKRIPLIQRSVLALMSQAPEFEGAEEIREEMHKVENTKLERMYMQTMVRKMTPIMMEPIEEGIQQGIFHMDYPIEVIETLLMLGYIIFDCNILELEPEEMPDRIAAFLKNAERMLGTEPGTLNEFLRMFEKEHTEN